MDSASRSAPATARVLGGCGCGVVGGGICICGGGDCGSGCGCCGDCCCCCGVSGGAIAGWRGGSGCGDGKCGDGRCAPACAVAVRARAARWYGEAVARL